MHRMEPRGAILLLKVLPKKFEENYMHTHHDHHTQRNGYVDSYRKVLKDTPRGVPDLPVFDKYIQKKSAELNHPITPPLHQAREEFPLLRYVNLIWIGLLLALLLMPSPVANVHQSDEAPLLIPPTRVEKTGQPVRQKKAPLKVRDAKPVKPPAEGLTEEQKIWLFIAALSLQDPRILSTLENPPSRSAHS